MANPMLKVACDTLENKWHAKGFTHLYVRVHGKHLVLYSENEDEKVNRARLTQIKQQYYVLGMANHRGTWEPTPFKGSLSELETMLTGQFPFALADF